MSFPAATASREGAKGAMHQLEGQMPPPEQECAPTYGQATTPINPSSQSLWPNPALKPKLCLYSFWQPLGSGASTRCVRVGIDSTVSVK